MSQVVIERVTEQTLPQYAPRLGAIISAQVHNGTSTHFLLPFTPAEATELFARNQGLLSLPGPGRVVIWVARLSPSQTPLPSLDADANPTGHDNIVGSVQLAFHTSPNGYFRTEVRKLIVDTRYQRRGIARALMRTLEEFAKASGSTLCLLDTEYGGPGEKLYTSLGWSVAGVVPNYAMKPDGKRKNDAVFMYKEL